MAEKILLVDDEEGIRKILGISLMDRGYEVFTAAGGEEALATFRAEQPEIVLTDIKMPGMDGIELLRKIKGEAPEAEVIMITGHGDMELAVKSLQWEAADFVAKPIHDEALEVALKRAHERIDLRRRLREYTEKLERLVEEKTRDLLQAERMAAIGQTVATLAHSIKNIIGGLRGGMYVLEKGMELNHKDYLNEGWRMIKGNVDRIRSLAMDLLDYAREQELHPIWCDPNEPLREVAELVRARAEEANIRVKLEPCPDLRRVFFDPEGVHCCLLNLVMNALDACTVHSCRESPREVVLRTCRTSGWAVEYQVEDNGCGMDEDTRTKVFRGFFSTKGSKGTGLGLMITQKIMREQGGDLRLESEPGRGTRVTLRIPELNRLPAGSLTPGSAATADATGNPLQIGA